LFPAVLLAVWQLARTSWRIQQRQQEELEAKIRAPLSADVYRAVYAVDDRIVASDNTLYDLVDPDNLTDFAKRWQDIVRLSPAVECALILDVRHQVVPGGYVSKLAKPDADAFQSLFTQRILPHLDLDAFTDTSDHHWNGEIDGQPYLISWERQEANGRVYFIVLDSKVDYIMGLIIDAELGKYRWSQSNSQGELVALLDEHGRILYGDPIAYPEGQLAKEFTVDQAFPTTLYKWRVRMQPKDLSSALASVRAARESDILLISLSSAVVLLGFAVLLFAVRTERKAGQLKSEFIANVSHELKTPLSLIRMFGELLALGKVKGPETAHEYAEIITREAERLGRLIDNVLDLSRIERGKVVYDFQEADLADFVMRALDVYRHRIEKERARLRIDLPEGDEALPRVRLDESAMTLCVINLVENAFKYGEGTITVRLKHDPDLNEVCLSVVDEGPGIPPAEQKRIFERFYRGERERRRPVRGTGIGLAIVKHVAEAHGGRVTLASEVGKGSAFTVHLPAAGAREGEADTPVPSLSPALAPTPGDRAPNEPEANTTKGAHEGPHEGKATA
jgi:two-component system phosphate regulon sensor histidine kinase PhoR